MDRRAGISLDPLVPRLARVPRTSLAVGTPLCPTRYESILSPSNINVLFLIFRLYQIQAIFHPCDMINKVLLAMVRLFLLDSQAYSNLHVYHTLRLEQTAPYHMTTTGCAHQSHRSGVVSRFPVSFERDMPLSQRRRQTTGCLFS
jgi:hypothetical protein